MRLSRRDEERNEIQFARKAQQHTTTMISSRLFVAKSGSEKAGKINGDGEFIEKSTSKLNRKREEEKHKSEKKIDKVEFKLESSFIRGSFQ